ncbi:MAG: hypothetical protein SFV55_05625, partial [Haliscomenobacter sp.]|uniref:hypothetical protein n=1 Tax=Haliscomenobacter sp. TaxID=2717303 RepID=UPI0029AF15C9
MDKGLIDSVIWYLLAVDSNKNAAISGFFEKKRKGKKAVLPIAKATKREVYLKSYIVDGINWFSLV